MEDFFIIGSEDPSFIFCERLISLPQFQGIVLLQGNTINSKHLPAAHRIGMDKVKIFSLGSFLLHARKNPDTMLVSCYDFPGGRRFVRKLQESARNIFQLRNFYNFCLENNVEIMYTPAQEERRIILDAKKEWGEFKKRLTDDYSRYSLECYLEAYEKMDASALLPVYVGTDNVYFNRVSRKLSLVPNSSEIYVDVGALDGDSVAGFVDCAGGYRAIYAFEPVKSSFERLKKRTFYLENFFPSDLAVSNKTGMLDFYADSRNSFSAARAVNPKASGNAAIERVPCTKLDDVLNEITLLKVEVEGHEPAVIEGATNLIREHKPDIVAHAYHYPLDPFRILEAVNKAHKYEHIALRFYTVGVHVFSLYFSDRAPFT